MKKLITLTAALFLAIIFSCNKSEVATPISPELKLGGQKHINAIIFTDVGYVQHTQHYDQGQILEFGIHYKTDSNAAMITDALAFLKNALLTGDTTEAYEHPFTYLIPNAGFLHCYPEPPLQSSPKFDKFKAWFEQIVNDWMDQNNCTGIATQENKVQYWAKVHCTVQ